MTKAEVLVLIEEAEASLTPGKLVVDAQAAVMRAQLAVLKAQVDQLHE